MKLAQFSADALQGEVVLVTGASRGIGHAVAMAMAHAGASVIGTATTEVGAEKITQALSSPFVANSGCGMVLNLNQPDTFGALIDAVMQGYGKLSVLVNNAGITHDNLSMRMKMDEWNQVIQTNLTAVFQLSQLVIKPMMKARFGRIINITSVVGHMGNAGQANYCAAKAGLTGMSKSLARELGSRNITVNCIAPGFIETDMTQGLDDKQVAGLLTNVALNRFGQAQDVAAAAVFLASGLANYITGATLHVNGGLLMD
jgi:3-oxoacyl-[acyl-carrier protein] reductase